MNKISVSKDSGFTLIELLIVVAIIGILAAIAIPNFLQAQVRSKVARSQADMRSLDLALTQYQADHGVYPLTCATGVIPGVPEYWAGWCNSTQRPFIDRFKPLTTPIEYISSLPEDPFINTTTILPGYYFYYDPFDSRSWILSGARFPASAGWANEPRLGQWIMEGAGPDNQLEPAIVFFQGGGPAFYRYDPTNGTISRGDIYRFGP